MGDPNRMSVSLSRRQLAAALLEYDNDSADPSKPRVHARDSALFLPFRPPPPPPPSLPLPDGLSEGANERRASQLSSGPSRQSVLLQQYDPKSRRSHPAHQADRGRRVYPPDESVAKGSSEHGTGKDEEMDVSRWDLPSHLVSAAVHDSSLTGAHNTETGSSPSYFTDLSHPATLTNLPTRSVLFTRPEPEVSPTAARAVSVHIDISGSTNPSATMGESGDHSEIDEVLGRAERIRRVVEGAGELEELVDSSRRRTRSGESRHSRLSMGGWDTDRARRLSNPLIVPLPPSPAIYARPASSLSQAISTLNQHEGNQHDGEEVVDDTPNPFALPAPPISQASRFDPKALHAQRQSINSMLEMQDAHSMRERPLSRAQPLSAHNLAEVERFPLGSADHRRSRVYPELDDPPPLPDHIKVYDEIPSPAEYGKPLRASRYGPPIPRPNRQSVLRTVNLVMPAPLAGSQAVVEEHVPDGWILGEKPLPPGSRTSLMSQGSRYPLPMSLSTRTFRSSLMVDGTRDDDWIGGAEIDGELGIVDDEVRAREERRPGKLFGTSLMDQLEARKAHMRGKQRVFTGDGRPAMMARPTSYISTQLSPSNSAAADTARPLSIAPREPLLQLDENGEIVTSATEEGNARMSKSKSVFGVDQIWEKEMAKLKIIEAEVEKRRAADRERDEREAEARKRRKGKGKARALDLRSSAEHSPPQTATNHSSPGVLPVSPVRNILNAPPTVEYSPETVAASTDYFGQEASKSSVRTASRMRLDKWENSSDEGGPVRRDTVRAKGAPKAAPIQVEASDDEEDVPLSRLARSKSAAPLQSSSANDNSEEDIPLSKVAQRSPTTILSPSSTQHNLGLGHPSSDPALPRPNHHDDDDDDDAPLMLRRARARTLTTLEGAPVPNVEEIEDDLPLGYKHAEAVQRQMLSQSTYSAMPPIGDWWASRTSGFGSFGGYPPAPTPPMQPPMFSPMVMGMHPDPYALRYPPMMAPWPGVMPPSMPLAPPGPESHIDRWRREIRTPSVVTGSSGGCPSSSR